MKRNLKQIYCKACGLQTKTNGIAGHIKSAHSMSVDEYVNRYGEFRPKQLSYANRASQTNEFICKVCQQRCASERHLSFHVKEHGLTKTEYIIQHIFNNNVPKCECGCGENAPVIDQLPYSRRFISGHNSFMHIGMTRNNESRMRMRESAIERIKNKKGVFFYNGVSKEETELKKFISEKYDGEIVPNDKTVLNGLEIDVYLPELKLGIELNGDRFHSDLYKPKNYHLSKTKECNEKGIQLIHIWLTDWYKKSEIVKSILMNRLGCTPDKVYARKTTVRELSNTEYQTFLNKNHLAGSSVAKVRLGLFLSDKLVQVMGFSSKRSVIGVANAGSGEWELMRLCSLLGTSVIGGANKLLSHFIKTYNPSTITSFADRDWSDGGVYEQLGFQFVRFTPPGYFYVKSKIRYNRVQFQKHRLVKMGFDPLKSEYEIMTENGYYRIWNTGNFLFERKCK